jgi:hypothetical protein
MLRKSSGTEVHDDSNFIGERYEFIWAHYSLRALPPAEGLESDDSPVKYGHDRLVINAESAPGRQPSAGRSGSGGAVGSRVHDIEGRLATIGGTVVMRRPLLSITAIISAACFPRLRGITLPVREIAVERGRYLTAGRQHRYRTERSILKVPESYLLNLKISTFHSRAMQHWD